MALSAQDLIHGIDLTLVNPITGADLNILVDEAVPVLDTATTGKGINLVTVDTALNVPDVPNPELSSQYNKWKLYIWVRKPHSTATSKESSLYIWNDDAVSDATFLKWINVKFDTAAIQAEIDAINTELALVAQT